MFKFTKPIFLVFPPLTRVNIPVFIVVNTITIPKAIANFSIISFTIWEYVDTFPMEFILLSMSEIYCTI